MLRYIYTERRLKPMKIYMDSRECRKIHYILCSNKVWMLVFSFSQWIKEQVRHCVFRLHCVKHLNNNVIEQRSRNELAIDLNHNEFEPQRIALNMKWVLTFEGFTLNCSEVEAFEALMMWIKTKTKQNYLKILARFFVWNE